MIDFKRMLFFSNKRLSIFNFGLCLIVFITGAVIISSKWSWFNTLSFPQIRQGFSVNTDFRSLGLRTQKPIRPQCLNVLDNLIKGSWSKRPFSKKEMDNIQSFLHIAREIHFLPLNLQRPDNRCGNVTFEGLAKDHANSLLWFRALCDPDGDLPCCYNNMCQAKLVSECNCPACYDMRQSIQTEIAEWIPSDDNCKITYFESEDTICQLIEGMTLYFIGDSFVRHMYLALLQILRKRKPYGPMIEYTPMGMRMACNEETIYLGMCMNVLDRETRECQNTVKLKFMEYPLVSHKDLMLESIEELRNVSNALLVIGIGIHDNFDVENVTNKVIVPVLERISSFSAPKPRLLWSSMHAPGLLKTPRVPSQNKTSMQRFNREIRKTLRTHNVPEFNTFQLTENALSFDGAHYGKGVNFVKSQILLNYILELRTNASYELEVD